ncbi:hypothetical protein Tco_0587757 [Tanacetum coccineum]
MASTLSRTSLILSKYCSSYQTWANCKRYEPSVDSSDRAADIGGILRRLEALVASPIGCGGSDVEIAE